MEYDPLSEVIDEPLAVTPETLERLAALRTSETFDLLPGVNNAAERQRLVTTFGELIHRLLAGISSNPQKLWVMQQFQPALEAMQEEDTEAREHFGVGVERIMDTLGIESSDGVLSFYLGGF